MLAATLLIAALLDATPAPQTQELQRALTGITEEIIEAIRTGNRGTVERHLAQDMILINRDGKEYSRDYLLAEMVPPPEGYDLGFTMLDTRVIERGESALLTFLLQERLDIFGHDVSTVYRNHLLFHRIDGAWKVVLYTYWEKPSAPAVISPIPGTLEPLVGTYELAPGKRITRITREGDKLRLQREGGEPRDLLPMAGDRFFLPDVEGEYYFEKDASGRTTALVFRRNWIDLRMADATSAASGSGRRSGAPRTRHTTNRRCPAPSPGAARARDPRRAWPPCRTGPPR